MGCIKHIVLVHGACLGGWSWFKVATALRAAGYRVDTPDLAASGVDPRLLREAAPTFRDYTAPLLDLLAALPAGDRVVLVGHSLGGINVALAAELFPEKVAAAVFLCAFMPDFAARPSHVLEKDVTLVSSLMRVSSMFVEDLAVQQPFTKGGYGSVRRVYVVCTEDHAIAEGFQRLMVENDPVDEVKEIAADHMVMLSRPDELVRCLTDIVEKYT
uniref:AB hydrolase-1 domain-containing protein n=1 Tax=Setaria italica TaxID=4555 RepID=K3XLW9_SETIT